MSAREVEVLVWSLPFEGDEHGNDIAVFADVVDPDYDDDRPIFRDGTFVREADYGGCQNRLLRMQAVVDLIERAEMIAMAKYRVRHDLPLDDYDEDDLGN